MAAYLYELVSDERREQITLSELKSRHVIAGTYANPRTRLELQGQPLIQGFVGPMYNGTQNGVIIIRYETKEHYATYD